MRLLQSFFTVFVGFVISACSVSGPEYNYCSVVDVEDPNWVMADRERRYLVSKIGIRHSRKAERDIVRLAKQSLAENIYSDVHSYTHSNYTTDTRGETSLVTNQLVNVATNLQLKNVRTDFQKVGGCLAAWATISPQNAEIALEKSHPINRKEYRAWQRIENSQSVSDYKKHLEKYPRGLYSETAKARIDVLRKHKNKQAINDSNISPPARMFWHLLNNIFY
ncbi:hypothetical protein [Idiomarina sp. UBA4520]|jgi:hypothetical protein|uniref:hypothetical protein n=1 Tax=Idiomarina sp. UBA4520 TaxID=1946647 RepID=UPI000A4116A3|nr:MULTISPECIES: hypothetical protein [unclassified Idiomarina]MBF38686.1 hypothetical protein [Idiomarinaceae bacterium]|tara:strand:- start:7125 stop:7790 length:666 start_codon:yes stop_codon:yes gene_type:complete